MISACVANVEHRLNQIRQICVWHACEQKLTSQREYQSNRLCTFANPAKGLFSFSVCDRNLQMFWINFTVDIGFFSQVFPAALNVDISCTGIQRASSCMFKKTQRNFKRGLEARQSYHVVYDNQTSVLFRSVLRCVSKAYLALNFVLPIGSLGRCIFRLDRTTLQTSQSQNDNSKRSFEWCRFATSKRQPYLL